MTPQLLNLLLWVPFVLTVLIAGLIYCISGYRRGLWRALISMGAVLVSTAISVVAARLLAGALAPNFVGLLLPQQTQTGMEATMTRLAVTGGISMVLALVLFGLFMLLFSIVAQILSVRICKEKLQTSEKKMKLFGLGAGVLSAVLFAFVWLAPLYGSLGTAAPVVTTVVQMQPQEASLAELEGYLESAGSHPLAKASAAGPVGLVYDSVASVRLGGGSVSVTDMAQVAEEAVVLLQQTEAAQTPQEAAGAMGGLVTLAREKVVEQDWFYALIRELLSQAREVSRQGDPEARDTANFLLAVLDMPKKDLQQTCAAVLDFAQFALEKGIMDLREQGDIAALYEAGLMQEAGKLFSASDKLVELKTLAIAAFLEENLEMTPEATAQLLKTYPISAYTDPEQQTREAEALFLALGVVDVPPALVILRHPGLGKPAFEAIRESVGLTNLLRVGRGYEDALTEALKQPGVEAMLLLALETAAQAPIDDPSFAQSMQILGQLAANTMQAVG